MTNAERIWEYIRLTLGHQRTEAEKKAWKKLRKQHREDQDRT